MELHVFEEEVAQIINNIERKQIKTRHQKSVVIIFENEKEKSLKLLRECVLIFH